LETLPWLSRITFSDKVMEKKSKKKVNKLNPTHKKRSKRDIWNEKRSNKMIF